MPENREKSLAEIIFFALLGALTGFVYGCILSGIIGQFFTNTFSFEVVLWCVFAFAVLGIFFENILVDTLLGLLHFVWGLINGAMADSRWSNDRFDHDPDIRPVFRGIAWIGFVTAVILYVVFHRRW